MVEVNRQQTNPLDVPRTRRNHSISGLTSGQAGKFVPLAVFPMLREDSAVGSVTVNCEMLETKELLVNAVTMRVRAFVVPWLAMERFERSRDQFDRSYAGQPQVEGGDVVPFFETHAFGTVGAKAVYHTLGLHAKSTDLVNTMYLEGYNTVWNFLAENRSKDLTKRDRLADTLAPAFWRHSRFENVVPDFDQAVIDGEVALNVVNAKLPVSGIGLKTTGTSYGNTNFTVYESGDVSGTPTTYPHSIDVSSNVQLRGTAAGPGAVPDVFAEMQDNGITISLSNIELAKKAQAFAKLRERFEGLPDEYLIDMLMSGLTIPDQHLSQPMLVSDQTVTFGQVKRYATDAGNLAESAVSGGASVSVPINIPRIGVGAMVYVVAEVLPEQLFERQKDPFFTTDAVADLPDALRDTLDPEKVDVVLNGEIDSAHATPTAAFGYAPMNWKWNAAGPKVGGKFYRPDTDTTTDTTRQRIWAVEAADPVLSEDFYIVSSMHNKPFLDDDSAAEPFEFAFSGNIVLSGNTQFGGLLVESTTNYDAVMEKAPTERIEKA